MRIELNKTEESILSNLFLQLSQEIGTSKDDIKYLFFQSLADRDTDLYNELLTSISKRSVKLKP